MWLVVALVGAFTMSAAPAVLPQAGAAVGGMFSVVPPPERTPAATSNGSAIAEAGGASEVMTAGSQFTDRSGHQVLLKSIFWDGFNDKGMMAQGLDRQPLSRLAGELKREGFNSVRMPFSNYMLHEEHRTTAAAVRKRNPQLAGLIPRAAFYRVVSMLTSAGLYVILDNHQTRPTSYNMNEGQWFTPDYDESKWLSDWDYVSYLFDANPRVIGYEFRNEVRSNKVDHTEPTWGDGGKYDWRRAQIAAATTVWRRNPAKIAFISGIDYDSSLRALAKYPITAKDFPELHGKPYLAYSVHTFAWFHPHDTDGVASVTSPMLLALDAAAQRQVYVQDFGFLASSDAPYTAPIWLSEFGVPVSSPDSWSATFRVLVSYLADNRFSFGYYTISSWYPKEPRDLAYCYDKASTWQNEPGYDARCNTYGLLNRDWSAFVDDWRLDTLRTLLNER
jgi:hypothetical protein